MDNVHELSDFESELASFIDEQEVEELGISFEDNFTVSSKEQAAYLVRKYSELKKEIKSINDDSDKAIKKYKERVETFKNSQIAPKQRSLEWIEMRLQAYAKEALKDSKKKSMPFEDGRLQFTKSTDTIYDDDKVIDFISNQNEEFIQKFLKVETSIRKAALKSAGKFVDGKLIIDEQEIPGVSQVEQDAKFSIVIK